ncbi:MAG TPA: hypothetical protein VKN76_04440, partial [Kiloniellaceae bacterium]|nr:hypothetical protein [Kiloniellaceae bacterium]
MTLSGRAAVLAVAILLVSLLGGRVEAGNGSRWLVGPAGAVLHAAPASTASVLDTLAPGRRLVEFERHGDWLRVFVMESVGLEGWVPAEGLEATGLTTSDRDDEAAGGDEDEDDGHGLTAPAAPFVLAVTGSPALAFSIDCRQVGSSGRERRLRAQGLVPR